MGYDLKESMKKLVTIKIFLGLIIDLAWLKLSKKNKHHKVC